MTREVYINRVNLDVAFVLEAEAKYRTTIEDGPAIANLAAAIQHAQQSVTHGYDGTSGARGTLAGGMYSGRTATGKSVFWYPGM